MPETNLCGSASLHARSYTMPPRWPLDSFQLVMENTSGSCDFYRSHQACSDLQVWPEKMVEPPVRESIAAVLAGCRNPRRQNPCKALDLGANNGWMSMIMLALGASVLSVEPASDFALAISESAHLNCFNDGERSVVLNAFACDREDRGPRSCMRSRRAWQGYRAAGGAPDGLRGRLRETVGVPVELILTRNVRSLPRARDALTGARSPLYTIPPDTPALEPPPHWELVKMDGDGPEGGWMRTLERLLRQRRLSVGAVTIEGNNLDSATMRAFQSRHGYTVYRLEMGDRRRTITPDGWDANSPAGTPMASITSGVDGRRAAQPRDALESEVFGLRGMRHLFRARANLTLTEWDVLLGPIHANRGGAGRAEAPPGRRLAAGPVHHWLLTTQRLEEPARPRGRRAES